MLRSVHETLTTPPVALPPPTPPPRPSNTYFSSVNVASKIVVAQLSLFHTILLVQKLFNWHDHCLRRCQRLKPSLVPPTSSLSPGNCCTTTTASHNFVGLKNFPTNHLRCHLRPDPPTLSMPPISATKPLRGPPTSPLPKHRCYRTSNDKHNVIQFVNTNILFITRDEGSSVWYVLMCVR